jgi:Family of unknown function (DUF5689)
MAPNIGTNKAEVILLTFKSSFDMRYAYLLLVLLAQACTKSTEFDAPTLECHNKFASTNSTLDQLVAMAPSSGFITIDKDVIFDAYVISSDQSGNVYKSLVVQNQAENPTSGITIMLDQNAIYTNFPFGAHVRINAKGLKLGFDKSSLKLGFNDPVYALGRIPQNLIPNYIAGVCDGQKLDVKSIVPKVFDDLASALKAQNLNQYIQINGLQFDDHEFMDNGLFTNPQADTSRQLIDKNKKILELTFSQYAKFAQDILPEQNGSVKLILGKYNTDYQGLVNDKQDIKFDKARQDFSPPIIGNALAFLGPGLEDFESYTTGATSENFPKYINDAAIGNKYWRVATFGNNKYLQLSGFTGQPPSVSLLVVPVDFSQVNKVSFKTKDGYYNGPVLKVYYSTDYVPGANLGNVTAVEITSHFNIARSSTTGYAPVFTPSGVWQKPATLNQKAYLIFEYKTGGKHATSTMQIDDLRLE